MNFREIARTLVLISAMSAVTLGLIGAMVKLEEKSTRDTINRANTIMVVVEPFTVYNHEDSNSFSDIMSSDVAVNARKIHLEEGDRIRITGTATRGGLAMRTMVVSHVLGYLPDGTKVDVPLNARQKVRKCEGGQKVCHAIILKT